MKQRYTFWQSVLWFVAGYHVLVGLLLLVSGELSISALKTFAGATVEGSPQLGIAGEILGCYILAFGIMMGVAAWNPVKNRSLLTIGLILIALRVIQRVYFADKVMQVFLVPPANYWTATAIAVVLGIILGVFRMTIYRDMHSGTPVS